MSTPVYYMPRPVDDRTGKECFAFAWLGQPFSSCDSCGKPYWEHTHESVAHPNPKNGQYRVLHRVIRADLRERVRAKWERR